MKKKMRRGASLRNLKDNDISKKVIVRDREKDKNTSHTSLLGFVYNNGCVVCSDMQATSGSWRASTREKKVFQIGDEPIVIASTGSCADTNYLSQEIEKFIYNWKSEHDLNPIPLHEVGEFLSDMQRDGLPYRELEAWFLLGGFDYNVNKPFLSEIAEEVYQSEIYQCDGSGSLYIMSKAQEVSDKVLGTLLEKGINPITVDDIYDNVHLLDFNREQAMLETLGAINAGPTCDVYSGGLGYQMIVLDQEGISEYILPVEVVKEILIEKNSAEYSAIHPTRKHLLDFDKINNLFEKCKRR